MDDKYEKRCGGGEQVAKKEERRSDHVNDTKKRPNNANAPRSDRGDKRPLAGSMGTAEDGGR